VPLPCHEIASREFSGGMGRRRSRKKASQETRVKQSQHLLTRIRRCPWSFLTAVD